MQRFNQRFYKTDIASWYDSEQRQLWMIDDPIAEREDAWNLWYVFDVYGFLITDYRWWGVWNPDTRHILCGTEPPPTEIVEEGRTYDLDVDELQDRINLHNPTLFYIYYQQDGTRGSHMKSLGDHTVPDLTSPRWDNFTPRPRSFRSRRVVSNRDDRAYFAVHPIRSINIHVLDRWREMYERDDPEGAGYESFCLRE